MPMEQRPLTDSELAAATVGETTPLDGPVLLAPYDPAWPAHFAREEARIRAVLGEQVLLLEHVGSTSVPGLSAKPIIDIVLGVADPADEASYLPPLEEAGYSLRIRAPEWFQHRMLRPPRNDVHLYLFSSDSEELARMLWFRDWLRAHPDDRDLYEPKKQELAAKTWKFTQNYADAKSDVVREILARAAAGGDC